MNGWDLVAWAYDAALHCPECAAMARMDRDGAEDAEGNEPHPVFATSEDWQGEHRDDCGEELGDE